MASQPCRLFLELLPPVFGSRRLSALPPLWLEPKILCSEDQHWAPRPSPLQRRTKRRLAVPLECVREVGAQASSIQASSFAQAATLPSPRTLRVSGEAVKDKTARYPCVGMGRCRLANPPDPRPKECRLASGTPNGLPRAHQENSNKSQASPTPQMHQVCHRRQGCTPATSERCPSGDDRKRGSGAHHTRRPKHCAMPTRAPFLRNGRKPFSAWRRWRSSPAIALRRPC